ncbi:MAG: efflux RND transporter periplasmic adaptor subunit [Acidobacteria bacterium]|nr:efflux RND transporter periplasmic adaptor subunit [Acidobacteriota bacterium]MBI3664589.1 efflux RND transporter periplasmic adaptor subunit [Acidobacteriota bacterium]
MRFRYSEKGLLAAGTLAALLALAALAGCSSKSAQSAGPAPAASAVPVVVATVQQKNVPLQLQAIGRVETFSTVSLKSQVSGEILSVHFKPGQDVRKGDLLFKIDSRTYEAALKQAEGNLARDIAQLENARIQARRYAQLAEQGVVAQQLADQMTTSAEAYEAAVRADRAAVDNAKLQIEYCVIHSPMDGRTGTLLVYPGTLVKANDNPILVVINQISPAYVEFSVPEQNLAAVKRHMAAGKLSVDAQIPDDAKPARGALSFVDNTVDRTTGTIRLRATFTNDDARLWPGQFVNVTLTLAEQANAIVAPSQAVQTGQAGQYVFVVKSDNTAEMRPVTVRRNADGLSVIEKGLQVGETVVVDGQVSLVPKAKVSIKNKP